MKKLSLVFIVIAFVFTNYAQTTAFTYQGKLTNGSVPANGMYSMRFDLFSMPSGGTPYATHSMPSVQVTNGIFTVQLDFGDRPFDGRTWYLEITVAGTVLSPRQQILKTPDAMHATIADNVSGVVQIANGGTGSSTKNFVDLSTNQTIVGRKTFIDQISGNGSGLTGVVGTMRWQEVSGTSQQAQSNNGYIANDAGQVTITLPANPSIGDVVRVSGVGSGGWMIAQNAGQSVLGANLGLFGLNWTARESSRIWYSVASSADGSKLAAAVRDGQIYTSTDSGVTWTAREGNRSWRSVASSVDGSKLIAVVYGGQIYTSTDSGVTWTPEGTPRNWESVASSADGSKLVAVVLGGLIYTSTDSGVNWTPRESNRGWYSIASSADGSKLAAGVYNGQIYTSTDSGVSWTARDSARIWSSVASSADGSKLAAGVYNLQIYTSTDSGVTWTPREGNRQWYSVASSVDGSKLAAVVNNGQIYTSTDSGVTWTPREGNRQWFSVASSADGSKLVAVVDGGQIYTSNGNTTTGTAGYLTGGQGTAIELQYIGNGQFLPISYMGQITGF